MPSVLRGFLVTPEQRILRARIAAHESWARTPDPAARTAAARKAAHDRFERQVREQYPDLSDDEVARRAEHARKAHMARLALASAKVRGARRAAPPSSGDAA